MMKQEDLFKKLGLILNELNEQYQFLALNPQQLNELELELFHANANFLAEHVQIIKKINAGVLTTPVATVKTEISEPIAEIPFHDEPVEEECQVAEVAFGADEPIDEPDLPAAPIEELPVEPSFSDIEREVFKIDSSPSTFEFILNDHAEHEKFEFEEKSVDELFNRPLSEEEEHILAQKIKLREKAAKEAIVADDDEIGPEPFLVKQAETFPIEVEDLTLEVAPPSTVIVNKVEPVEDPTFKPTLNDLLAKSVGSNVNTNSGTAIKDLKQAINLNDKLLYIKDLFNGYNLAYSEAIDIANKLPNFEAADHFFQKNYAAKNNWAGKQATVDKFYELLNRRFV
jgi:hypothetical protein